MAFHIRRATLADIDACARVCLLTVSLYAA
jgi:hypothetical protein